MNIGIDISQTAHEGSGVARFTSGLATALLRTVSNDDRLIFFYSSLRKPLKKDLANAIIKQKQFLRTFPVPPTVLTFLWNHLRAPSVETFLGPLDWFISSDWTEPPSRAHKATIIHDLVFRIYPETVHTKIRSVHEKRLQLVTKESARIFCDSQATKNDLVKLYNIAPDTAVINYPGVEVSQPNRTDFTRIKKTYAITRPYILTVAKLEPRKNINRFIEACSGLKNDIDIFIVGPIGWGGKNKNNRNTNIRFLGYVPDNDLYALYANAEVFVYPSLYEGFGYPVVEAMLLNCPVAISNTSSLPEVGGEAAVYFDPYNTIMIRRSIEKLLNNPQERHNRAKSGSLFAQSFTWNRYITILHETLMNYER